jgi:hypothetical protein
MNHSNPRYVAITLIFVSRTFLSSSNYGKSASEGGFSIFYTKTAFYCGLETVEEQKLLHVQIVFVCFIVGVL